MSDEDTIENVSMHPHEGLAPQTVDGSEPGSTYTVVLRSRRGYVAVRRLGEDIFRIRCERFDKSSLVAGVPEELAKIILAAQLKPAGQGERISGIAVGHLALSRAIGVLGIALTFNELDPDKLPIQLDEGAVKYADHVKSCLHCAKGFMLTPTGVPAGEVLATAVPGVHDYTKN